MFDPFISHFGGSSTNAAEPYHPDVIALGSQPLPRTVYLMLYSFTALFLLAIGWLIFGKLDRVVEANASLVSKLNRQTVRAPATALIETVNFRVGELVNVGDELVRFDSRLNKGGLDLLKKKLEMLRLEKKRILAEIEFLNGDINFNLDIGTSDSEFARYQLSLFQSRVEEVKIRRKMDDKEMSSIVLQMELMDDQLRLIDTEVQYLRRLAEKAKFLAQTQGGKNKVDEALMRVSAKERDRVILLLDRNRLESRRNSIIDSTNAYVIGRKAQLQDRLSVVLAEISENMEAVSRLEVVVSRDRVLSEISGIVVSSVQVTTGSVVQANDVLIEVMEKHGDQNLEIEAQIAPQDAGWVQEGMHVDFSLASLPPTRHGTLSGVVVRVANDANGSRLFTSSVATEQATAPRSFRASIKIEDNNLKDVALPQGFKLVSGMAGTAEIKVGTRRPYEYLLDEVFSGVSTVLNEKD